jgi:dTDP-4-amino-4,6-dideoxygalactose transaminase
LKWCTNKHILKKNRVYSNSYLDGEEEEKQPTTKDNIAEMIKTMYFDDKQYTVKYADVAIQSYHPVKHITTGEGGAVLTNSFEIDEKVRRLRAHGMTKDSNKLEKIDGPWYYEMHEMGYNYRITDFQCALGSSQLKKLDQFIQKRRKIANIYDKSFSMVDNLKIPKAHNSAKHAYHLYPLQIDFDKLKSITKELSFTELLETYPKMLKGEFFGRAVVNPNK